MTYKNILTDAADGILTITINRPKQLNALNSETIKELNSCLEIADEDESVKVLIITGSGDKAFVAGADIKEFAHFSESEGENLAAEGQRLLFNRVEQMSKPVIAAVNGFALGGGLELTMSCHVRVASENAKMGLPEVSLGVIPGYGGTQRLAQLVGKGKALELITTAGMMNATDALQWGLVNHVTSSDELMAKCKSIASKMMKNSPRAIHSALKTVLAGYTEGVNGFEVEVIEFGKCFGTEDFKEGTTAFIERRKPEFTGK